MHLHKVLLPHAYFWRILKIVRKFAIFWSAHILRITFFSAVHLKLPMTLQDDSEIVGEDMKEVGEETLLDEEISMVQEGLQDAFSWFEMEIR